MSKMVPISSLLKACSFTVYIQPSAPPTSSPNKLVYAEVAEKPQKKLPSHGCAQRAHSLVKAADGEVFYRCIGHEGKIDDTQTGEVITEVTEERARIMTSV